MSGPFGDLQRLIRYLDTRLDAQPEYADVRNLRALARAEGGDLAGARSDFEAALGVNPEYARARFGLAWVLVQSREPGDVARGVDVARPLPEPWRTHLDVVRVMAAEGADSALVKLAARGGAAHPWFELDEVWLLVEASRWDEAIQSFLRLAAADADLPALLHTVGLFARGVPDRDRLATWAAAYRGNPEFGSLCQASAELVQAAGDVEAGRQQLAWGVALSLDLCSYWTVLGTQHESLGEERTALVALRRAVQVDPQRVEPHTALGYLFAARGQPEEAIAALETAVRLAPGYADLRYQLGLLYSDVGRVEEAERELQQALGVQPSYVLARLALGCLLETRGRDEEALELLQSVRRAGVRSADLEAHLATLHARLGHRNQARRAQARARASQRRGAPLE
jgi:protein O-GlcNAc transferase